MRDPRHPSIYNNGPNFKKFSTRTCMIQYFLKSEQLKKVFVDGLDCALHKKKKASFSSIHFVSSPSPSPFPFPSTINSQIHAPNKAMRSTHLKKVYSTYHCSRGRTKNGNERKDRYLANKCSHCLKDQHTIYIQMLHGQKNCNKTNVT